MPEVLEPSDHPRKAQQVRGKYEWDKWLHPGAHLLFHQQAGPWGKADFPGTQAVHFRQAFYNAVARMRLSGSAKVIDSETVEAWVYEKDVP